VNGELQKPEDVRKYLQKLLTKTTKQKAVSSPWVVASLPETKSFIKLIQIKKPAEELIEDDILIAVKKHMPLDEGNFYLQWQIMPQPNQTDKTNVLVGAIPKLISDSFTYLLESVGLGVVALELEPITIARAMVTARKQYSEEARAILDIGATRSCLIIYDNETVQFSISLPFSGEAVTNTISQRLHCGYDEAEEIKITHGLQYNQQQNRIWNIVSDSTKDFIGDIKDAFNFYYTHFPNAHKITRIIMCGGGANLLRLDRVISSELKITARPGLPWKNLRQKTTTPINQQKSLEYATAIGLAIRAADNPFFNNHIV
jgi:type IV pilus assembly protein PilM